MVSFVIVMGKGHMLSTKSLHDGTCDCETHGSSKIAYETSRGVSTSAILFGEGFCE